MRTDELDFDLPSGLIARRPADPRDSARLMVLIGDRAPEHRTVRDLPEILEPSDALVFNTSAVIPARVIARRPTGRRVEGLALAPTTSDPAAAWRVLLRGSARLRVGERLELDAPPAAPDRMPDQVARAALRLLGRDGEAWHALFEIATDDGSWIAADGWSVLATSGWTPLPPYILKARELQARDDDAMVGDQAAIGDEANDRLWYQTIYADGARRGSVAAPTAGLHFTPAMLERLGRRGIGCVDVTLHVGEGTFRPVSADTIEEHVMHAERFEVGVDAIAALRRQRAANTRIIGVGSTAARTLESLPVGLLESNDVPAPIVAETRLLIVPPYRFRNLDGLLTNFHLPRSTLLAMVAALVGLDRLMAAYAEAIAHGYRFFSYGDAMLILPEPAPTTPATTPASDARHA